jgi:hypothetical protein
MRNRIISLVSVLAFIGIMLSPLKVQSQWDCATVCIPVERFWMYHCPDGTFGIMCVIGEGNCDPSQVRKCPNQEL